MGDILVSITCATYNHEKYIAEAIESFLMQKTNFKYEILLHDDASTDRTPEIIKEYENKYPEIIKPIYQTENQYSKGVKVGDFNSKRAQGKYIATCEGDDYWTDPNKLQKQVDFMENNQDYSACVHAAYKIDAKTNKKIGEVRPYSKNKDFTIEEVILGGGGLFATNSTMRARKFSDKPQFYYNCNVGDFPSMIHLAISGKVHYIDEFMSAYRIGVENSWTVKISNANTEKRINHIDNIENMLKEVDEYTKGKYTETINKKIKKNRFNLLISLGKYKEAKSDNYREHYKYLGAYDKSKIFVNQYFPVVVKLKIFIKRKLK
jgi:glycosyltransferase involved in cell wall biosynthesis